MVWGQTRSNFIISFKEIMNISKLECEKKYFELKKILKIWKKKNLQMIMFICNSCCLVFYIFHSSFSLFFILNLFFCSDFSFSELFYVGLGYETIEYRDMINIRRQVLVMSCPPFTSGLQAPPTHKSRTERKGTNEYTKQQLLLINIYFHLVTISGLQFISFKICYFQ